MTERVAACACGQLSVTCQGAPQRVSLCHCFACQKRTGSAFGLTAFYPREAVTATGRDRIYRQVADSGRGLTYHFCPDCGTTVYWEPEFKPEALAVAVGAFADPSFPAPSQAVHQERAHPWVKLAF